MINQEGQLLSTRDRLVAVSRDLFAAKGYLSTSVADILREAEVNSGSLYYFFATKQDLLLEVLRAYRDGIDAMLIEPAWRGVEDPIEKVFALLGVYRGMLAETDYLYGCPIGSLALELHEPDPPVRELLAENFDEWKRRVKDCFHAGRSSLPQGVSPEEMATLVLTVMEGAVMQARTYRSPEAFDVSVQTLRTVLNASSRPPGNRARPPRKSASKATPRHPTSKGGRPQ
jgi:TetR/AcrR family transcriptional regulator, transcriptional repressor for nem operon